MPRLAIFLSTLILLSVGGFAAGILLPSCTTPDQAIPETQAWGKVDKTRTHIRIEKSKRLLTLFDGERKVVTCPVVLGGNPVDDKRMEGDSRTPEGKFKLRDAYAHAKWSRFLWIDYPTEESWRRFEARKAKGEIPEDATIGGEIGIHGVPEGMDNLITEGRNWTLGCISLRTTDIIQLYNSVQVGTAVEILH